MYSPKGLMCHQFAVRADTTTGGNPVWEPVLAYWSLLKILTGSMFRATLQSIRSVLRIVAQCLKPLLLAFSLEFA
jgi:hypothetical protein